MPAKLITAGLYGIPLGQVNAFLLTSPDGDTVIDTGMPGGGAKILDAIRELGKQPSDIRHILLTHAHPDHIGGVAELKKATGAEVYMHPLDAPIATRGAGFRPLTPAPGLRTGILFRLFISRNANAKVEGVKIDRQINDGERLPLAGGLRAIHVPGHCAGQLAFLWEKGSVLIAADACSNVMGLGLSLGYEDLGVGKQSLKKLSQHEFQIACFGHGNAITRDASAQFKAKWG